MTRKEYSKPYLVNEIFTPQEYITTCIRNDNKYTCDDFYYIDFINRVVKKVTPSYLSELLEDYHNLQMRYEGMKDYKKREIIEDYFLKYIDRASSDVMRPDILDIVDESEWNNND